MDQNTQRIRKERKAMKFNVNVSDEYIDSLCEWMLEWAQKDTSLTIPQFQQERGICNFYINYFKANKPKFLKCLEITKAVLCNRWMMMGMNSEKMAPHKEKIMNRYIRLYDTYSRDLDREFKQAIAEVTPQVQKVYYTESFADRPIATPYDKHYDRNVRKQRDSSEA